MLPPMAVRAEPKERKEEQCYADYEELMQMQVTQYRNGWIEVLNLKVFSDETLTMTMQRVEEKNKKNKTGVSCPSVGCSVTQYPKRQCPMNRARIKTPQQY